MLDAKWSPDSCRGDMVRAFVPAVSLCLQGRENLLQIATQSKHLGVVNVLLARKADPSSATFFAIPANLNVLRALLAIDSFDKLGALTVAAQVGSEAAASMILSAFTPDPEAAVKVLNDALESHQTKPSFVDFLISHLHINTRHHEFVCPCLFAA